MLTFWYCPIANADAHGEWYGWYLRMYRRRIAYPTIQPLKGINGYTGNNNDWNWVRQNTWVQYDTSGTQWYHNVATFIGAFSGTATCWESRWSRRRTVSGVVGGAGVSPGGWESFACSDLNYFGCANYDGRYSPSWQSSHVLHDGHNAAEPALP